MPRRQHPWSWRQTADVVWFLVHGEVRCIIFRPTEPGGRWSVVRQWREGLGTVARATTLAGARRWCLRDWRARDAAERLGAA